MHLVCGQLFAKRAVDCADTIFTKPQAPLFDSPPAPYCDLRLGLPLNGAWGSPEERERAVNGAFIPNTCGLQRSALQPASVIPSPFYTEGPSNFCNSDASLRAAPTTTAPIFVSASSTSAGLATSYASAVPFQRTSRCEPEGNRRSRTSSHSRGESSSVVASCRTTC